MVGVGVGNYFDNFIIAITFYSFIFVFISRFFLPKEYQMRKSIKELLITEVIVFLIFVPGFFVPGLRDRIEEFGPFFLVLFGICNLVASIFIVGGLIVYLLKEIGPTNRKEKS